MIDIRNKFRQSPLIQNLYYGLKIDAVVTLFSKQWYNDVQKTLDKFLSTTELDDQQLVRQLKKDIYISYLYTNSSPAEYFLFNFRKQTLASRKTYLTDKVLFSLLSKNANRKLHDAELNDKYNFYLIAKEYFHRKVMFYTNETLLEDFATMVLVTKHLIFKPNTSACGGGIFVADVENIDDVTLIYNKLKSLRGNWIVEERINQSLEMAVFNESSVNTIRITTISNSNGIVFHMPFIRVGRRGSFVDNGGQGGIYALLDLDTGRIISNGKDEKNNEFIEHPDSHVVFLGWQVPRWYELKILAQTIHSTLFPKHKYIGWDFALTDEGWVLIEGNWGEYVCQQSVSGRGLKKEFIELLKQ